MVIDYNKKFNDIIKNININNKPNLFLHVCCAPCSSAVFKRIYKYFNIFVVFHNPNIDSKLEFDHRYSELIKLTNVEKYNISILYANYDHNEFLHYVDGLENEPEGGRRCIKCFELRLRKTFDIAIEYINKNNLNNNYLCTTLSISPHKNAEIIENIGEKLCENNNLIKYLPSDFKKEDGYLNSIRISKKIGLYRQNYCGCEFAKMNKNY